MKKIYIIGLFLLAIFGSGPTSGQDVDPLDAEIESMASDFGEEDGAFSDADLGDDLGSGSGGDSFGTEAKGADDGFGDDALKEGGTSDPLDSGLDDGFADSEKGLEETPAPEIMPEPPPTVTEAPEAAPAPEAVSTGNAITNIEFRTGKNAGTVVIETSGPVEYTTRPNEGNLQFVVELPNTKLPKKFKRPYNTKEFPGPVAGIQAYQKSGASTARVVVQLRSDVEPVVQQVGKTIMIVAAGSGGVPAASAEDDIADDSMASMTQNISAKPTKGVDPEILANQNFNSFLMGQTEFFGKPISIQVKDADISDVFNFIAEESGLNIVLTDSVKGKVTLKLRKIPWDQALVVLMKSYQLGYIRQGNVLRIAPLTTIQNETTQAGLVLKAQNNLSPLRVKVFPVSYAKAKDLEAQVTGFLTEKRGGVKADERTNSLIVTDIDEVLKRVERLITELDTQTPQVLIEAKIVEARQDFQRLIGVDWSTSGSAINLGTNAQGSPVTMTPGMRVGGTASPNATALSLSIGTLDVLGDIDARLNLFELDNKVKVISSPKVVALNGISSTIEQTTEIPIQETRTDTSGGVTTSITFKPLALKLVVKPQISADGAIIMEVELAREFLGAANTDGNRAVNKRGAKTTILVNNGQTAVMGGIYQSDVTEGETGVPFLRKVPFLGGLFKSNATTKEKNELLIFLTPKILNTDRAFRSAKGG